jgi:TfoX/Sxy family transcriptional regulator of competence genes
MCDSPSWIIDANGKCHWLTDAVAEAAIEAGTIFNVTRKPMTWEDAVGHSAIEQLLGVSGKHHEGRNGLPDGFASDIRGGRYTRLARAGSDTAIRHIPDLLPPALQAELGIMFIDRDGVYVVKDGQVCVVTCGSSAPQITQSGGEVRTYGSSAPQITQSGGEVWTYDSSAPQITQSGGEVVTCDSSAPQITQSGGEVWTYDSSAPQITQSGGEVLTYDSSAPQITQSGGEVWTYGSSRPTVTASDSAEVTRR